MKTVILWTLAAIAALVLVILGVGMALPEEHVASVRATYEVGAAELYARVADIRSHPQWRSSVDRIEELPARGGRPAWREIGPTGPLPMELTVDEPPRRMVTRIASEELPFGGRWTYEFEEADGGTTLTITEEGEVYNPFFRFVSRFVMGYHATAETYLADLGRSLGEEVEVEIVR